LVILLSIIKPKVTFSGFKSALGAKAATECICSSALPPAGVKFQLIATFVYNKS